MNIYFERKFTKKEKRRIAWSALFILISAIITFCTLPQKNKASDCFLIPESQHTPELSYTLKKECIEYIINSITLFDQFMHIVKMATIFIPIFITAWLTIHFISWINETP